MLGGESPDCLDTILLDDNQQDDGSNECEVSALSLVCRAEYLFNNEQVEDAFRVASQVSP